MPVPRFYLRAKSEGTVSVKLKLGGGYIDLTGPKAVRLVLRDSAGNKEYFDSAGPKLDVSADPTNGRVDFTPADTDFTSAAIYDGYFWVDTAGSNPYAVPEHNNFILEITDHLGTDPA